MRAHQGVLSHFETQTNARSYAPSGMSLGLISRAPTRRHGEAPLEAGRPAASWRSLLACEGRDRIRLSGTPFVMAQGWTSEDGRGYFTSSCGRIAMSRQSCWGAVVGSVCAGLMSLVVHAQDPKPQSYLPVVIEEDFGTVMARD